jgi:hypothetical protein
VRAFLIDGASSRGKPLPILPIFTDEGKSQMMLLKPRICAGSERHGYLEKMMRPVLTAGSWNQGTAFDVA